MVIVLIFELKSAKESGCPVSGVAARQLRASNQDFCSQSL
jgi:hypothetical protein